MIVPFQMVMFTLSKLADMMHLGNPLGIVVVYLGFGAGLSVFMFCGFVKSIPTNRRGMRSTAAAPTRPFPSCYVRF